MKNQHLLGLIVLAATGTEGKTRKELNGRERDNGKTG